MPDAEIEQMIGPGLEPTDDFLSNLRERVAGEWHHGVIERRRRRPRLMVVVGLAAAIALVAGAVAWFGRDSKQTVAPATTTTSLPDADGVQIVAKVVFDEPTDAWVTSSEGTTVTPFDYVDTPGRHVLFQRDGAWFVGYFDEQGLVTETPMDTVPAGESHDVRWTRLSDGSESIMIDWYSYRLTADGWVQGGRIEVLMAMPPHIDADRSTPQAWVATYYGVDWTVPTPVGWDGQPPAFAVVRGSTDGTYDVAMVAHTATESLFWLLNADGGVVSGSLDGIWSLLNADEDRLELSVIDPARLDYSVVRVPWSTVLGAPPLDVPPGAVGVRWAIVEADGVAVERSPMPWFRIDGEGNVRGFDGCAEFTITANSEGSAVPEDPSCVPVRPDLRALGIDVATWPAQLTGNDFQAVAIDAVGNVAAYASGRFTVAGSGSTLTLAPDGWLSVGSCANVAIWRVPDTGGDLTITPVDRLSVDDTCGAPDVVAVLAEPGLQLSGGWLSSSSTVLQLKDAPVTGRRVFSFGVGTATLLDGSPLSSSVEVPAAQGDVEATMTPSGRIFVSVLGNDGWSVEEYIDGGFRPTGLVSLASSVFSGAGEDLYLRDDQSLVVLSETDAGWRQRETIPALQGECYLRRLAFETVCGGAHAAVTPPAEFPGFWVVGDRVGLWSEGRSIIYRASLPSGEGLNCESDNCLRTFSFIPGGGAVWAPQLISSDGTAATVAAVLRPGLEPVVVTFGPDTETDATHIIGVIGEVIHVLRWTGSGYRLESFQLPLAGPGPSFQP